MATWSTSTKLIEFRIGGNAFGVRLFHEFLGVSLEFVRIAPWKSMENSDESLKMRPQHKELFFCKSSFSDSMPVFVAVL